MDKRETGADARPKRMPKYMRRGARVQLKYTSPGWYGTHGKITKLDGPRVWVKFDDGARFSYDYRFLQKAPPSTDTEPKP